MLARLRTVRENPGVFLLGLLRQRDMNVSTFFVAELRAENPWCGLFDHLNPGIFVRNCFGASLR